VHPISTSGLARRAVSGEGSEALWVTADCVDPQYARPVVDSEQDVTAPVPHRRVEGHFAGTDKKFVISLPPADKTLAPDVRVPR
jgi:hypothetical protein